MTGIPRATFEESERLLQNRQFDAAQELIMPLLEQFPDNHDLWHNIAIIKMYKGDFDQSEAAFLKCFAVSPYFEDALHNMAMMYYHAGQLKKCLDTLRKLIALNPNHAEGIINAGDTCYMNRLYWDAYQYYRRYLDIFPYKKATMLPKIVMCLQYAEAERTDDINVKFELYDALCELMELQHE